MMMVTAMNNGEVKGGKEKALTMALVVAGPERTPPKTDPYYI